MPALTTRQEARARVLKTVTGALNRMIPPEGTGPLKGSTFLDWEEQAGEFRRTVLPVLPQERAALKSSAHVNVGGPCPFCGSDRTCLEKQTTNREVHSPDGPVVPPLQGCRRRHCDGSFSPSGS